MHKILSRHVEHKTDTNTTQRLPERPRVEEARPELFHRAIVDSLEERICRRRPLVSPVANEQDLALELHQIRVAVVQVGCVRRPSLEVRALLRPQ